MRRDTIIQKESRSFQINPMSLLVKQRNIIDPSSCGHFLTKLIWFHSYAIHLTTHTCSRHQPVKKWPATQAWANSLFGIDWAFNINLINDHHAGFAKCSRLGHMIVMSSHSESLHISWTINVQSDRPLGLWLWRHVCLCQMHSVITMRVGLGIGEGYVPSLIHQSVFYSLYKM